MNESSTEADAKSRARQDHQERNRIRKARGAQRKRDLKVALARIVTLEREIVDARVAAVMQAGTVQGTQPQQVNDMPWELDPRRATIFDGNSLSFQPAIQRAIEAYYRLPISSRSFRIICPYQSDFAFFAFGFPREGMVNILKEAGVRRPRLA